MVKKLLKYEFSFYYKRMLPLFLVVLGTALLNRITQFFEADTSSYRILFGSSVVLLVVASLAAVIGVIVIAVSRYYKNMFANEGYLTLSLPVTSEQHLVSKLTAAFLWSVFTGICVLLGIAVATAGDVFAELMKAGFYMVRKVVWPAVHGNTIGYGIEFLLALITASVKVILLCYACLSIGQRAKKNRIGLSVGCFFIYYFACQILGTISVILVTILAQSPLMEKLLKFLEENTILCLHLGAGFVILWNLCFAAVYFLISNHILKKKLNLE